MFTTEFDVGEGSAYGQLRQTRCLVKYKIFTSTKKIDFKSYGFYGLLRASMAMKPTLPSSYFTMADEMEEMINCLIKEREEDDIGAEMTD